MHIDDQTYQRDGKTYRRVLIRKSIKENGKYKKKTVANISDWPEDTIEAIKIALNNSNNISHLSQLAKGNCEKGKNFGLPYVLDKVSERLGIKKVLGDSKKGKLAQWMVMSRLIDQSSRLAAVRLANTYAVESVLDINEFNEDDLYSTLDWLYKRKDNFEVNLFNYWQSKFGNGDDIYLYDVTSSYFEGEKNFYADYGYNRDNKKGKQQIVYGVIASSSGEPFGIEAFQGNTGDTSTFRRQISKMGNQFDCDNVVFVGDKGMIKSPQIEDLSNQSEDYNYITSIGKREIRTFLKRGTFQLSLFTEDIKEVYDDEEGVRYILRRNPCRAKEIRKNRSSKIESIKKSIEESNQYLVEHPGADPEIQIRDLKQKVSKLKLSGILSISQSDDDPREIGLEVDEQALEKREELDGCYAIKTDLPKEDKPKEAVHARYKDLSKVEWIFRTSKDFLGVRPIFLQDGKRTVSHLFIVMLAYKIERYLREHWEGLDMTVPEGIEILKQYTGTKVEIGDSQILSIPQPREKEKSLFDSLDIELPDTIPYEEKEFVTRNKLNEK